MPNLQVMQRLDYQEALLKKMEGRTRRLDLACGPHALPGASLASGRRRRPRPRRPGVARCSADASGAQPRPHMARAMRVALPLLLLAACAPAFAPPPRTVLRSTAPERYVLPPRRVPGHTPLAAVRAVSLLVVLLGLGVTVAAPAILVGLLLKKGPRRHRVDLVICAWSKMTISPFMRVKVTGKEWPYT